MSETFYIANIDGKTLHIFSFEMTCEEYVCDIHVKAVCEGERYSLDFYNTSDLKMKTFGHDIVIEGFEIIDNSSRGWESAQRYTVDDFENETISFYCESYEISKIE